MEDDQEDGQAIGENNLTIDTEKTISWAVSQSSLQAHVTSNKPKDNRNCSKKALKIKKLEVIRKGAILPDNIWLSNHMSNTRMSKEEYDNRCESLKKSCNKIVKCNAHTSLENLRKISKGLKEILSQTDMFTEDWDRNKKIMSGKYGYLNLAVNYPEILRETKLIRNLIKSFNSSRENLRKYRDIILSYNKKKPNLFKLRTTTKKIKTANKDASNEKKVLTRLVEKLSPYSERDFKIISSRAFLSVHVREIFLEWEKDNLQPFGITEASKEAIDNLNFEYPNLQKWDYFKIMDRISENWVDRDIIQAELNKEVLENAKSTDLNQREEMNPDNVIEIDETDKSSEILESMIKENPETLNWEKVLPLTRYKNEAPAIILENIDEVTELNVCTNEVNIRDLPSKTDLSVLPS